MEVIKQSESQVVKKTGLLDRSCSVCGKSFKGRSRKCSHPSSNCIDCGKVTNSRTAKKCKECRPKICQTCGRKLPTEGHKSKYCDPGCAEKGKKRTPKNCLVCGKLTESRDQKFCKICRTKKCRKCQRTFTPRSSAIIYCSTECRLSVRPLRENKRDSGKVRNINVDGVEMRLCSGHEQFHSTANFPKNKYFCKQWRSDEGKKKYEHDRKSADFMQSRRDRWLFNSHGLSPTDLLKILEAQNFSCLVCGVSESGKRPWHIDHDHNCCPSGKSCQKCRRGILCFKCNTGLGCLKDSIPLLEIALQTITQFRLNVLPKRVKLSKNGTRHSLMNQKNFAPSYHLRYAYSVDLEELLVLIGEPISCLICKVETPGAMSWNVDHDHQCCPGSKSCGKCIRGILCHLCNKGIGLLGDDPLLLSSAISYLESYEKK